MAIAIILREETIQRFQIDPDTLKAKASCKVVVRCPQCQEIYERVRYSIHDAWKCKRCTAQTSHTKTKKEISEDLPILEKETLEQLGYAASSVGSSSTRKVVIRCQRCQKIFLMQRCSVKKDSCCKACRNTKRWQEKTSLPLRIEVQTCLNDKETLKRFGYAATSRWALSYDRVIGNCKNCNKEILRRRRVFEKSQLCKACSCSLIWTSEILIKKNKTIADRYEGQGVEMQPPHYGKSANSLKIAIEKWLPTPLLTEKPLLNGKRLDFYSPTHQIGIEYNGLHFHHELSKNPRTKYYHLHKQEAALREGIQLIHIFEDEWRTRPHAIEGVLKARFGIYDVKIGARKCQLVEIDKKLAFDFMNLEHWQGGSTRALHAWGMYHREKLLGAVTLATHHRKNEPDTLVLDRLCFANGVLVVGGSQRLLQTLILQAKHLQASKIISWSNRCWARGTIYERLGFEQDAILPPDYTYVDIKRPLSRKSKQSEKKVNTSCPADLTEHQWALQRGLARIWDCGRIRWVLKIP